jgi:hypothetical protein
MMKYLFVFAVIVALYSCNGQSSTSQKDSLTPVDTNAIKGQTNSSASIKKYHDSVQNKVIANINFGIDSLEYERLSKAYTKAHTHAKRVHIGNYEFVIFQESFFHHKLYEVELFNPFVHSEDELKQLIQGADDLITSQYGKADSTHEGTIYKDNEDLFVWHIGRKRIKISSSYSFNEYGIDITFTDLSVIHKIEIENRVHRDSLTKTAKKDI